jgi:hypothetical protein
MKSKSRFCIFTATLRAELADLRCRLVCYRIENKARVWCSEQPRFQRLDFRRLLSDDTIVLKQTAIAGLGVVALPRLRLSRRRSIGSIATGVA